MRKAIKRKMRKAYFTAPIHVRRKQVTALLSPELRKKVGKRSAVVKKGYKVKILRGSSKGKEGEVLKVSYVKRKVFIEGITHINSRGEEKLRGISPSNVMITKM